MSLLDTVIGAVSGANADGQAQTNPMIGALGELLTTSGGLQGLMDKFSQAGLGSVFSSWVGTGPNQPIRSDQVAQVLGSEQVRALAAKIGVDPAELAQLVAEHLPQVVDHLTPAGQIDPNANVQSGLAGLLPSLLQKLTSPAAVATTAT